MYQSYQVLLLLMLELSGNDVIIPHLNGNFPIQLIVSGVDPSSPKGKGVHYVLDLAFFRRPTGFAEENVKSSEENGKRGKNRNVIII